MKIEIISMKRTLWKVCVMFMKISYGNNFHLFVSLNFKLQHRKSHTKQWKRSK
jgi:hypothetical protein